MWRRKATRRGRGDVTPTSNALGAAGKNGGGAGDDEEVCARISADMRAVIILVGIF